MAKPKTQSAPKKVKRNVLPLGEMILQSKIYACDQMIEELSTSEYSKGLYANEIEGFRKKRRALVRQFVTKYSK